MMNQIDTGIINQLFSYFSSGIFFFIILSFNILILKYQTFNIYFLVNILSKNISYTNSNITVVIIIYLLLSIIIGRILIQVFNFLQLLLCKNKNKEHVFFKLLKYPVSKLEIKKYNRNIKDNYRFILNFSKSSIIGLSLIMIYNLYSLANNYSNTFLSISIITLLILLLIFNIQEIRIINKGLKDKDIS